MLAFIELFLLMGGPESGKSPYINLIFLGAIFLVMYLFMIRPQAKKAKEQKKLLSDLKKGDQVVSVGGLHGKITKVSDNTVTMDIGSNTIVKVEKSAISLDFTKKDKE